MFNKSEKDSNYFCCLCISKDKSVKICTVLLIRNEKYINIFKKTFSFLYGFSIGIIFYDLSNRFLSIFTAGNTDEINNFRTQHSNYTFIKNYTDNEITKTIRYLSLAAIAFYALYLFILSDYFFVTYNYAKKLIDSINGERDFRLLEEDAAWE
ncbi:hypothetical protein H8356DRAFT_1300302 [Neocallimastix lanati (nom. inval.)]|nr:hypothetical protein H8356DRAFT_1300302 [Neocallimastix sp. JGI-2020a]